MSFKGACRSLFLFLTFRPLDLFTFRHCNESVNDLVIYFCSRKQLVFPKIWNSDVEAELFCHLRNYIWKSRFA